MHLEFGPFSFPEDRGVFDVTVFAGDRGRPITETISWIGAQQRTGALKGRPAVFVPCNHEFYRDEINAALLAGQRMADRCGVHMLAPGAIRFGDVRVIGATLWTDYGLLGDRDAAKSEASKRLIDHQLIKIAIDGENKCFKPDDAEALHKADLSFVERRLAEPFDGATVVVTHHAPHPGSVQLKHLGDPLSPAFSSDLTAIIERYQPELWIHGHDHGSHDYRVGRTRIVSNQAGYPKPGGARENLNFDPGLVIEVEVPN